MMIILKRENFFHRTKLCNLSNNFTLQYWVGEKGGRILASARVNSARKINGKNIPYMPLCDREMPFTCTNDITFRKSVTQIVKFCWFTKDILITHHVDFVGQ